MADPTRSRNPGILSFLAGYAALGFLAGGLEAIYRVLAAGTPSVLRRGPGLVLTAMILYGLVAGAAGLLHWLGRALRKNALPGSFSLDLAVSSLPTLGILVLIESWLIRSFVPSRPAWFLWGALILAAGITIWIAVQSWKTIFGMALASPAFRTLVRALRLGMMLSGTAFLAIAAAFSLAGGGPGGLNLAPEAGQVSSGGGRPNVLVILVDTLRADHLSAYGSPRRETPRTSELAARGTLFENAWAPCSWTTPSIVSLLTSRFPSEHGVTTFEAPMTQSLPGLPGILAGEGYTTAAIVSNPLLDHRAGFDRGYEVYDTYPGEIERSLGIVSAANGLLRSLVELPLHKRVRLYPRLGMLYPPRVRIDLSDYTRGDEVTDLALSMLDQLPGGKPFYLYVHYGDPHTPYLAHPFGLIPDSIHLAPEQVEQVVDRYNEEVAFNDAEVGRLLDGLAERGLERKTIVVFVADHGEEFLEHGVWEHGQNLHRQALAVPILFAGPGVPEGDRRPESVSLIDVAPTILELLDLPPGEGFRGRKIVGKEIPDRPILSQVSQPTLTKTRQASILHHGWRYIRHLDEAGEPVKEELYDTASDPEETEDLSVRELGRLAEMRQVLDDLESILVAAETPEGKTDEEMLERLRSLGYVD